MVPSSMWGAEGQRCLSATDMVIIYLSSGVTSRESSEQEKRATLSVVREENRHLNNSVMILTYALMNGTRPPTIQISICPHLLHTLGALNEWLNLNIKMVIISAVALPFLCLEEKPLVGEVLGNLKGPFFNLLFPACVVCFCAVLVHLSASLTSFIYKHTHT